MSFIQKYVSSTIDSPQEIILVFQFLLGMAGITFLGNIVNAFSGVSLWFLIGIMAVSLLYTCLKLRTAIKYAKKLLRKIKPQSFLFLLMGFVILIVALSKSTVVTENMDEMGYYLTTVKWIESGPTISGIGLFNGRLAINSAWHMSSAIFGFDFLYRGGAYDLNAFLFCLVFIVGIITGYRIYRGSSISYTSDILLLSVLVFPFHSLIDSMDADYPSIFIGIFLIAEIIRRIERNAFYIIDSRYYSYVIVSLFLFTIKPFSIVYLLYPLVVSIYHFIKRKRAHFLILVILSLVYSLPWFYHNYLISGYIIYPLHIIDLFDTVWKLPYDYVRNTSLVVAEYAKVELIRSDYLYTGVKTLNIMEWLPTWISNNWNLVIGKFVIIFLPLSVLGFILESVLLKVKREFWVFKLSLLLICLFWFFNFPSIRFGWAFILGFIVVTMVGYTHFFRRSKQSVFYVIAFMVVLSVGRNILKTANDLSIESHLLLPKRTPELLEYNTVKTNFTYYQSETEYCYDKLPCMPVHNPWKVIQRTEDINDGFILMDQ